MVRFSRLRIPAPLLVSTTVVLALLVIGVEHRGPRTYDADESDYFVQNSNSKHPSERQRNAESSRVEQEGAKETGDAGQKSTVDKDGKGDQHDAMQCFKDQPWIEPALDYFFEPALEAARESTQTTEESMAAIGNITWGEYHPGQDLMVLKFNKDKKWYDLEIEERFPANREHKSRCIRPLFKTAVEKHGKDLAEQFQGKEIKFAVATEDFGLVFRSSRYKLTTFALSTDGDHTDIPIPDFTFGCYPESRYEDSSWKAIGTMLKEMSSKLSWSERSDSIFHRSNWGVGPRRKLMPLLEKLHKDGKDVELFGAPIDVGNTEFEAKNDENFVRLEDQCKYKTQIHTAGFSYSAGLKYKLACGSMVIKFTSKYKEFYEPAVKDGIHVVQVEATDDGVNESTFYNVTAPKIKNAVKKNLDRQSDIAKAGQDFVMKNLTEDALSCYIYGALQRYAKIYLS